MNYYSIPRKDIHSEPLVVTSACGALDPLKDDSTELANLLDETSQQHYLSIWPGELLLPLPLFQKIKSTWFDVYLYEGFWHKICVYRCQNHIVVWADQQMPSHVRDLPNHTTGIHLKQLLTKENYD
ncbi:MAG TPA: hypothetical protein VIW25_02235 [Nitrososphaeraceae archaeon]